MNGAMKFDQDKPDLSLISYELVEEVALVRMYGAKKYARDNWKNGFAITRSIAAALRHILKFNAGQTYDYEASCTHCLAKVCSQHKQNGWQPQCRECNVGFCPTHSGRPHPACAICALEHILYDLRHHPENDDRYVSSTSTPSLAKEDKDGPNYEQTQPIFSQDVLDAIDNAAKALIEGETQ